MSEATLQSIAVTHEALQEQNTLFNVNVFPQKVLPPEMMKIPLFASFEHWSAVQFAQMAQHFPHLVSFLKQVSTFVQPVASQAFCCINALTLLLPLFIIAKGTQEAGEGQRISALRKYSLQELPNIILGITWSVISVLEVLNQSGMTSLMGIGLVVQGVVRSYEKGREWDKMRRDYNQEGIAEQKKEQIAWEMRWTAISLGAHLLFSVAVVGVLLSPVGPLASTLFFIGVGCCHALVNHRLEKIKKAVIDNKVELLPFSQELKKNPIKISKYLLRMAGMTLALIFPPAIPLIAGVVMPTDGLVDVSNNIRKYRSTEDNSDKRWFVVHAVTKVALLASIALLFTPIPPAIVLVVTVGLCVLNMLAKGKANPADSDQSASAPVPVFFRGSDRKIKINPWKAGERAGIVGLIAIAIGVGVSTLPASFALTAVAVVVSCCMIAAHQNARKYQASGNEAQEEAPQPSVLGGMQAAA